MERVRAANVTATGVLPQGKRETRRARTHPRTAMPLGAAAGRWKGSGGACERRACSCSSGAAVWSCFFAAGPDVRVL